MSWKPYDLSVTDLVLYLPLALDLVAYWSAMCRRQRSNLFMDELR